MSLKDLLQRQVQFFHPEKKYAFLRGGFNSTAHAAMFGLREQFYTSMKQIFVDRVNESAKSLCEEVTYRNAIKAIPLKPSAKVVVLGDSLTDDSQSWFSIIEQSFALVRPQDDIQFTNLAVSGDTTAQLLGSVIPAAALKADLYLCFSGTNDARIQGGSRYKPCTSLDEVGRNLASVMDFSKFETAAPWVWISPIGVDANRVAKHDFFKPLNASWCNEQIGQTADMIHEQADLSIDLRTAFGNLNDSSLLDDDGLHWSIEGQMLAAKIIVKQLVRLM